MKIKYIIRLCLIVAQQLSAQTTNEISNEDHLKYLHYRNRLQEEFVIVGYKNTNCEQGSGLGIPAHSISYNKLSIGFGEEPLNMGWYIAVLATEIHLLFKEIQSYDQTLEELYYAMKAYERCDLKCEKLFYPGTGGCNLNGLFSRGDVPEDFLDANENYSEAMDNYQTIGSTLKSTNVDSMYNHYASPDQIAGLYMGFACVVNAMKELEAQLGYKISYTPPGGSPYYFLDKAREYTKLIADRLKSNEWFGKLENGEVYPQGYVFLAEFIAYGFADAAERIIGGSTYTDHVYTKELDNNILVLPWNLLVAKTCALAGIGKGDEYWQGEYLECINNSWGDVRDLQKRGWLEKGRFNVTGDAFYNSAYYGERHDFAVAHNLAIAACGDSWPYGTMDPLNHYAKSYNMFIYPFLHGYLYEKDVTDPEVVKFAYGDIKSAPCVGPFIINGDGSGVKGWRATNKYWRPIKGNAFDACAGMYVYTLIADGQIVDSKNMVLTE